MNKCNEKNMHFSIKRNIQSKYRLAIFYSILAAALYAISTPFSKILLTKVSPMMMAAFLYLGAGFGMLIIGIVRENVQKSSKELRLTRNELPYIVAMVLLDIAAPIFLMFGLKITGAANASLLNNFEIVATAVIALFVFKEVISKQLWFAIALITLASILLSVNDLSSISFSWGSGLILMACICWGIENNCTRKLSTKDPLQIVVIKGIFSGFGSLAIAFSTGELLPKMTIIPVVLLLGFVAYGLSIFFYVYAQREIGAAKTSAYYAIAPFIGAALSFIVLGEHPNSTFIIALIIMILGAYFAAKES
jgi:drug/metabolite transporter (DMT)-like permease